MKRSRARKSTVFPWQVYVFQDWRRLINRIERNDPTTPILDELRRLLYGYVPEEYQLTEYEIKVMRQEAKEEE